MNEENKQERLITDPKSPERGTIEIYTEEDIPIKPEAPPPPKIYTLS